MSDDEISINFKISEDDHGEGYSMVKPPVEEKKYPEYKPKTPIDYDSISIDWDAVVVEDSPDSIRIEEIDRVNLEIINLFLWTINDEPHAINQDDQS